MQPGRTRHCYLRMSEPAPAVRFERHDLRWKNGSPASGVVEYTGIPGCVLQVTVKLRKDQTYAAGEVCKFPPAGPAEEAYIERGGEIGFFLAADRFANDRWPDE